jgi:hypothetical protein
MKKTNLFPLTQPHIFGDSRDIKKYYCMDIENSNYRKRILELHGRREKNVLNEFTVKCKELGIVEETDTHIRYDVVSDTLIEFPINQIHEILIEILKEEISPEEGIKRLIENLIK